MDEPLMLILGERRKRGQPPLFGVRLSRKVDFWVTEDQFQELKSAATGENKKVAEFIRDAVNTCVGDFQERSVFRRTKDYRPE